MPTLEAFHMMTYKIKEMNNTVKAIIHRFVSRFPKCDKAQHEVPHYIQWCTSFFPDGILIMRKTCFCALHQSLGPLAT